MTIAAALRTAAQRLAATSDTARLDAELLMAHAMGTDRSDMLLRRMTDPTPPAFAALVDRRAAQEPVAYIVGEQEFYGLDLIVTPAVLIPRADSEALIEGARGQFSEADPCRILDLGTGSGALLLAALSIWPDAEGLGIDSSFEALMIATRNAQRHANVSVGVSGNAPGGSPAEREDSGLARLIQRNWNEPGWANDLGRFDLILANPPYVEDNADLDPQVRDFEPASALFAGPDGLDAYRVLVPQLPQLLTNRGVAVLEIGASQARAVAEIASNQGFTCQLQTDLADRPRALILRFSLGKGPASG